jgi:hypothetical protein
MIKIILEGGLGGHMPHLYESWDLTFSQMKDVFKAASKGELEGTEKTDGQNIKLSFNVKTQKAVGARTVTQIRSGGLDTEEMLSFFVDHKNPNLKLAFPDAIKIFEKAVKLLDVNKQIEFFGPDSNNWYMAEVMDDRTRNVINYDTRNLLIQRTGHISYDKQTGKVQEESDIDKKSQLFMDFLEKVQKTVSDKRHSILVNPIQTLKELDNKEALIIAYSEIDKVVAKHALKDSDTISEFLRRELMIRVKANLPLDIKEAIINGTVGFSPPIKKREIKKGQSAEIQAEIDKVLAQISFHIKQAMLPIEILVTDFAAEMLKTLESIFILDNKEETRRLSQEVSNTINSIQSSDKKGDIDFLNRQLEKLKGAETVSSAVEGFAFSYNGVLYKFTGKFAPINQILGLSKYGRSTGGGSEELEEQQTSGKFDTALLGGGFKPPHKGHIELIKQLASTADKVLIFTSDVSGKDRNFTSGQLKGQVIDGKKSNDFLKKMISLIPGLSNVKVITSKQPLREIFEYVEKTSKFGESILIGVGDKEDDAKRFATLPKYTPAEKRLTVKIEALSPVSFGGSPLSASRLREAISNNNLQLVISFMPDEISNKTDFAKELINSFLNNAISEMSGLAAGAVAGHVDNKSMGNKNMRINRQSFMNEIELRKTIREALILRRDKKLTVLKEEKQLRGYIRAIIKEAKQDFNYGNTGLNKLGSWLQAKIPLLKSAYKGLATDKTQRDAFRARLMQLSSELFDELESKIQAGGNSAENDLEEDLNVSLDGPDINDTILPVVANSTTKPKKDKSKNKNEFKIEPTGEGEATDFFGDYEDELSKVFVGMSNPIDRKKFKDYYMSNYPAIMDQAEGEASNVAKPVDTTPPEGAQVEQPEEVPETV